MLTAVVKIWAENTGMIMIRRFGGARTRARETSTLQYTSKREHNNGQQDPLLASVLGHRNLFGTLWGQYRRRTARDYKCPRNVTYLLCPQTLPVILGPE